MPKVTVLIATYNRAHYICEAVDSVLAQAYKDYEIIIVDDGSTDKTREVLQKYADKISYLYKDHKNQAAALNFGISRSKGEYIAFLDDDDIWLPNKLTVQIPVFEKDLEIGIVGAEMYLTNEKDEITSHWKRAQNLQENFASLYDYNCLGFPSVVARKSCIEKVGGFDEGLVTTQDYDLWLRMAPICKFRCLDVPLVKWRIHGMNKHKNREQKLKDRLYVVTKPGNISHLTFIQRKARIAKEYYNHGQYFQDMRQYGLAVRTYFKAVIICPFIGYYYPIADMKGIRSTAFYKVLRTYLKIFYCFWEGIRKK